MWLGTTNLLFYHKANFIFFYYIFSTTIHATCLTDLTSFLEETVNFKIALSTQIYINYVLE